MLTAQTHGLTLPPERQVHACPTWGHKEFSHGIAHGRVPVWSQALGVQDMASRMIALTLLRLPSWWRSMLRMPLEPNRLQSGALPVSSTPVIASCISANLALTLARL